jgi:hypothetical protein
MLQRVVRAEHRDRAEASNQDAPSWLTEVPGAVRLACYLLLASCALAIALVVVGGAIVMVFTMPGLLPWAMLLIFVGIGLVWLALAANG